MRTNRYYGQLLERKLDGTIDDALATDSQVYLDNRLATRNMRYAIERRMTVLNDNLGKRYVGYRIMEGSRRVSTTIFKDGNRTNVNNSEVIYGYEV